MDENQQSVQILRLEATHSGSVWHPTEIGKQNLLI